VVVAFVSERCFGLRLIQGTVVMVSEMEIEIEMLVCLVLTVMGNMYVMEVALRRVVIRSAREIWIVLFE
jgi:hypothetical protein